jgi:hypothetical protein
MRTLVRLAGLCGGFLLVAGAALPQQEAPPKPPLPDLVVARFSVPKRGDALILPVRLGDRTYQFLLDTGCSFTAVDTSLLPKEPLETVTVLAANGKMEPVPLHTCPPFWLGDMPLDTGAPVAGIDLRPLREVCGWPVYGLIGMNFLAGRVVQVNFDRGELTFYRWPPADAGAALPFELERHCPVVVGHVGDRRESFTVDTGAVGTGDVRREVFAALEKAGDLKVLGKSKAVVLNGTQEYRFGQGQRLALGEFAVQGPVLNEGSSYSMIGLGTLSRFVVTFDFRERKLYLKKGADYDRPGRWDLSGLRLVRRDGVTLVESVEAGGAAAARGVKPGDVLRQVGPTPAGQLSLFEIGTRLSIPNTTVRLAVARGTEERNIDLVLKQH